MAHEIIPIEGELADLLEKVYGHELRDGFVKVDGLVISDCYKNFADAIENFHVRDDDIWVCSFPKTGTTWTQEMVWCIVNDLHFSKVSLTERFPYFDISTTDDYAKMMRNKPGIESQEHLTNSISFVDKLPSPRFIKTHLPFHLLPRQLRTGEKKCRIVYVVRNAKDTFISYYHHSRIFENYDIDFNDFCALFLEDAVMYAPFWKHVLGYWNRRDDENLLFLKFEDMKKDLRSVIQKTAKFFGKNLTIDEISTALEHLSFASMKTNQAVNNEDHVAQAGIDSRSKENGKFMRSGEVGQWKASMSSEQIEQFDEWTRENLKGTCLHY